MYSSQRFPELTPPLKQDDGFLSLYSHEPIPLTLYYTSKDWSDASRRPALATAARDKHGSLVPPSYLTFPVVSTLQMSMSHLNFNSGSKQITDRNKNVVASDLLQKWTRTVDGYEQALHGSAQPFIYNSQNEPDPSFPTLPMFGKFVNPLTPIVHLSMASEKFNNHQRERMETMFRNYIFFVVQQYWLTMQNRFLVYTGKGQQKFDTSKPPFIYAIFHAIDYKLDEKLLEMATAQKILKKLHTERNSCSWEDLAKSYNLTDFIMLVLWGLLIEFKDTMSQLQFYKPNWIASIGKGTLKTNTSKIYMSCRFREIPYNRTWIQSEIRQKLSDDFNQSNLKNNKSMAQNPLGFRTHVTRLDDERIPNFHTHHFMSPIHPLLDSSVYDASLGAKAPDWAQGASIDTLFQPHLLHQQLASRKSMMSRKSKKMSRQTTLDGFVNVERKEVEEPTMRELRFLYIRLNHIVLQLLRFAKASHIESLRDMFEVDKSDQDFEDWYFTLGTDRLLYSAWINENKLYAVHPYLDRIGRSEIFVRPVWCLNNYSMHRFRHELASITDQDIRQKCNPEILRSHMGETVTAPNQFSIREWDGFHAMLMYKRIEPLHPCEKFLLRQFYDILSGFSRPHVWTIYQALLLLTGSHSVTLKALVVHWGVGLEMLQNAEKIYFNSLKAKCGETSDYDGESDMEYHIGDNVYLYPLFYESSKDCKFRRMYFEDADGQLPVNSFVGWLGTHDISPLTRMKNDIILHTRSAAFRAQVMEMKEAKDNLEFDDMTHDLLNIAYACMSQMDTRTDFEYDQTRDTVQEVLEVMRACKRRKVQQ